MKSISLALSITFFCLSLSLCAPALAFAQVLISEVSPNPLTGEPEWVELFNAGSTAIPLAGWKLQDKLTTPSDIYTFSSQIIEPQQFLVAELSSAKLNNAGDGVTLFKNDGSISDTMDYTSSEQNNTWQRITASSTSYALTAATKGTNSTLYSLLSVPSPIVSPTPTPTPIPTFSPLPTTTPTATSEATGSPTPSTTISPTPIPTTLASPTTTPQATVLPQSTPAPSSSEPPQPTATPLPSPTPSASPQPTNTPLPTATPTPTPTPSVPPGASPSPTPSPVPGSSQDVAALLQLSEIMACPASGTEWVELYNPTPQDVTLSNWHITDEAGNSKVLSGSIQSQKWAVFSWTGSLLNNSGDSLTIVTSTNQAIAQASYDSCSAGESLVYVLSTGSTTAGKWVTTTTPTPGGVNILPATPSTTTATASSSTPSAQLQPPKVTTSIGTALPSLQNNILSAALQSSTPTSKRTQILGAAASAAQKYYLGLPSLSLNPSTSASTSANPFAFFSDARSTSLSPTASNSAIFIGNSHLPPKTVVFGGILSGLLTITSSCAAHYGKKLLTLTSSL